MTRLHGDGDTVTVAVKVTDLCHTLRYVWSSVLVQGPMLTGSELGVLGELVHPGHVVEHGGQLLLRQHDVACSEAD